MKMEGSMYTCDRCGFQLFVPASPGRYYNLAQACPAFSYTPAPAGWTNHSGMVGLLCGACSSKYDKLALEFMERKGETAK